ncbi:MAG: protein kinase [Verrucomicrobia bacterium]|nr:protein kinase [Verrucomicrobiota bacterium]
MTQTAAICPDCGKTLPANAPAGLCPACLLRLGEEAPADSSPAADPGAGETTPTRIGRYKLLENIGEGGFGTVWMAEQQEPVRRKVALKIIKLGMDTRQVVARFEAERQALALMDHPNIARVFDAGATESGRPYFVMELVRGLPITEFCDARQLTTRGRIELFLPVCQAVQHAHQKGVIHRDLKPSNILVTEQDGQAVPKVIDFGVAKAIEEPLTDKTLFTRFHQFLGTPTYMSPEQAGLGGLDVDTRSDIYSLGVLLYEMLTGRPPLDLGPMRHASHEAVLKTIREVEPLRPSTRLRQSLLATRTAKPPPSRVTDHASQIDPDLDWIVLKALEKDRARRYETANGLAADLRRYLDDEPVTARPPSRLYRFRKLARRNKVAVAAVGALVIALVAGLIATTWQAYRARRHLEQARRNAYVSEVNVAQQALAENHLAHALQLLDRHRPKGDQTDLRGFEWRYLWQLCRSDSLMDFHDEGAHAIEFCPDGRWFAYGGWTQVVVRDAASYQVITHLPTSALSLSCTADGRLLATANGRSASVWDTATWQQVCQLPGAAGAVLFSPDGSWLITGQTNEARLVLWERGTWRPRADCPNTPEVRNHVPSGLAFSPDGRQLATLWVDFTDDTIGLRFWQVPSLNPLDDWVASRKLGACAAFDARARHLLTGTWDGRLLVWDLAEGAPKLIGERREHSTHVTRLAVSRAGQVVATVGEDQTLNLWERATYRHLARIRAHTNQIYGLAISPDGQTVLTGSAQDGVTRVWRTDLTDASDRSAVGSLIAGFTADSRALVLGPRNADCRWQLLGPVTNTVAVATNLALPGDLLNKPFDVFGGKPTGALGHSEGLLELWDLSAGTLITRWQAETNAIRSVPFSPDGRQVVTGSAAGGVRIWDVGTRAEVAGFRPAAGPVTALAYSPDGKRLAAAVGWGRSEVELWDVANGHPLPFPRDQDWVAWLEFSPDGHLVAAAGMNGDVELWQLSSGGRVAELKGHVMGVLRACFFPDGQTLATGGLDGRVKLWNLATFQEILTLAVPLGTALRSLCIAPDGRTLAVGYMALPGHYVRFYSAPSLAEIAAHERDHGQALSP